MPDGRLTWRELKEAVNKLPEELLDNRVFGWLLEDEGGIRCVEVMELEEDYFFNGDSGCAKKSEILDLTGDDEATFEEDYPLVHRRGTLIIVYEES